MLNCTDASINVVSETDDKSNITNEDAWIEKHRIKKSYVLLKKTSSKDEKKTKKKDLVKRKSPVKTRNSGTPDAEESTTTPEISNKKSAKRKAALESSTITPERASKRRDGKNITDVEAQIPKLFVPLLSRNEFNCEHCEFKTDLKSTLLDHMKAKHKAFNVHKVPDNKNCGVSEPVISGTDSNSNMLDMVDSNVTENQNSITHSNEPSNDTKLV